jgi:hypothetical protein
MRATFIWEPIGLSVHKIVPQPAEGILHEPINGSSEPKLVPVSVALSE